MLSSVLPGQYGIQSGYVFNPLSLQYASSISQAQERTANFPEFNNPYVQEGEAFRFLPEWMEEGRPYPFRIFNWWFIAVKRENSEIEFFYIP